jgi:RNA polymerase-binding transcription factor DksA
MDSTQLRICREKLELEKSVLLAYRKDPAPRDYGDHAVVRRRTVTLYQVKQALKRMTAGQFGYCRHCGRPINFERLMVLPYAELCVECQRCLERETLGKCGRIAPTTLYNKQ